MCQEVFQIAMSMDLKSVEMQLALPVCPTNYRSENFKYAHDRQH